jgi:hypothetical protein
MRRFQPYILALFVLTLFPQKIVPQTQPSAQPSTTAPAENTKPKAHQPSCTNNGTYVNSKGQNRPSAGELFSAAEGGDSAVSGWNV